MREIKFRLWNPERKVITAAVDLNTLLLTTDEDFVKEFSKHGMIWMQYTGLKDKNGKEIYEGDVVILAADQRCIIEYQESRFIAVAVRPPNNFPRDYIYFNNVKEVIGNMYENPELLTNDKARVSS